MINSKIFKRFSFFDENIEPEGLVVFMRCQAAQIMRITVKIK
jgi:hypothetical protein